MAPNESRITPPTRLLIAGIPAAGKSKFGNWLHENHGYIHIDMDKELGKSTRIDHAFGAFLFTCDVHQLLDVLDRLGHLVVIDWGFMPMWIPYISAMMRNGMVLWWLDGDRRRAREKFIEREDEIRRKGGEREPYDIQLMDNQMARIEALWPEFSQLVGNNIIHVLHADGPRMPHEEIWRRITGAGDPTS
jgi:hypothetical protein